jgi:hypothetical protein
VLLLVQARDIIAGWIGDYNIVCPPSSIGYAIPATVAAEGEQGSAARDQFIGSSALTSNDNPLSLGSVD